MKDNDTANGSVIDEQLAFVSGGSNEEYTSEYTEITVKDGENNSALCPFCSGVGNSSAVALAYDGWWKMRYGPSAFPENYNHFHCPVCNHRFIKDSWGKWLVK